MTQLRQSPQTVQNVVTFDAVISVDNGDLALKPGITASTRIVVDRRDDVIRVPNQALRYAPGGLASTTAPGSGPINGGFGENARIWVLRDGQPIPLIVTPGLDDESFTEIVKGDLSAGDQVVIGEERASNGGRSGAPLPRP